MGVLQSSHIKEERDQPIVEVTNHFSSATFSCKYLPAKLSLFAIESKAYGVNFRYAEELSQAESMACFKLVELTSAAAYKSSSRGWKPKAKEQEMSDKDMRYLLVQQDNLLQNEGAQASDDKASDKAVVEGFLSFMITEEDDYEVLYIYEIHLGPCLRKHGIGRKLMHYAEEIASKVGLEKVMLTVFTSNEAAESFYRKIGYTDDEYSPAPKILRNGVVKRPDYIIMSKAV
ncbi:acyl-CoA N-acyltransferase [Viridothelium virens]|uniref:N-alpha-acetyltransferase 40 n=1 Tax=Viridothelium virens TaxID=1048519 RepID=A0A6A6HAY4_VIRVR|nr:acyl-CoA N-acyltransferase [Viridothelium virens]